jgi:hypothetical protein
MLSAKKELFTPSGGGYQIARSVRLRSSASAYFNRTLTTPTNNKIWTYSVWVKKARPTSNYDSLFSISDSKVFRFGYSGSDFILNFVDTNTGWYFTTTQVFRDPSAWMHLVLVIDTTDATAGNRTKVYVNGIQVTAFSAKTDPSQNAASSFNAAVAHYIGQAPASGHYFDGYMTEVNFIDGQALTPSSFGETNAITGVWQPKKYAGTYGTNGFYLNFSDNSNNTAATIGKDNSGNGNNWTPNNISVTAGATYDSMLDVPTPYDDGGNGRGNYCTLNPLENPYGFTLSAGNLDMSGANAWRGTRATIGVTSGKWYWEYVHTSATAGGGTAISTQDGYTRAQMATNDPGSYPGGWQYTYTGQKANNGSSVAYGAAFTQNDVVGVAFDADAGTLVFYKNGVSQGTAYTGLISGPYFPTDAGPFGGAVYNFGQRPFAYTPPTGFKALNTQNLPDAPIKKGNAYFDATTYSGQNTSLSITNSGSMQPDLVWIKKRSGATDHNLTDVVRGTNRNLISNSTAAEDTVARLTSFDSGGFTLAGSFDNTNISGSTYVAWQWDAGTTTVTNTSGSISAQVRANPTAGFSVVTYTGTGSVATVGHGLGVTPQMVIIKNRTGSNGWTTYHAFQNASPASGYVQINSIAAFTTFTNVFNNTAPTSSVFTVGTDASTNGNTNNFVAYCFAPVAGYSAFGKYTGNGSADGPFVYCGFRPRYVLVKRSDSTGNWFIWDSTRDPYNTVLRELYADATGSEYTRSGSSDSLDLLSNGFKIRLSSTYADRNANGGTYIFMAFAENPFKNSLAR